MTKLTYDPEVDALYIELRDDVIAKSVDIEEGVTLDYDANGQVIGIEILDVRLRMDIAALTKCVPAAPPPLAAACSTPAHPDAEQ